MITIISVPRCADHSFCLSGKRQEFGASKSGQDLVRIVLALFRSTMIRPDIRKQLSQDIRRLVNGQLTNDEFDEVYYTLYEESDDRAVREIASFCYCLYSSDLLFPYRLRNVDRETRSKVARSVLFLRSGLRYEWRAMYANNDCCLGVVLGVASSLACIALAFSNPNTALLPIICLMPFAGWAALAFYRRRSHSGEWKSFEEAGDSDVWPFLRHSDFDTARQSCHMFAKGLPSQF